MHRNTPHEKGQSPAFAGLRPSPIISNVLELQSKGGSGANFKSPTTPLHSSTEGNAPKKMRRLHRPHSGVAADIGGHRHRCAPQHKYSNCDQNPFEVWHSFSFLSSRDLLPTPCCEIMYGKPWHIHSCGRFIWKATDGSTHTTKAPPQSRATISCNCQLAAWMRKFLKGDARGKDRLGSNHHGIAGLV
jgi:hypothetical protein